MALTVEALKKLLTQLAKTEVAGAPVSYKNIAPYLVESQASKAVQMVGPAQAAGGWTSLAQQKAAQVAEQQAAEIAAAQRASMNFPQRGVPAVRQPAGMPTQVPASSGPTQTGIDYMSALPKLPATEAEALAVLRMGVPETLGSATVSRGMNPQYLQPDAMSKVLAWAKANPLKAGAMGAGAAGLAASPFLMQGMGTPQQPPTDAMPITIDKAASQMQSTPAVQTAQGGQTPNKFWEWFKQYGVPLTAAGVGMASDSALPAATGFSTGYVGERQRQQLSKEEADKKAKEDAEMREVYAIDEETKQLIPLGKVAAGSKVSTLSRPSVSLGGNDAANKIVAALGGAPTAAEQGKAQEKKASATKIVSPDGEEDDISSYSQQQIDNLIRQGYRLQ